MLLHGYWIFFINIMKRFLFLFKKRLFFKKKILEFTYKVMRKWFCSCRNWGSPFFGWLEVWHLALSLRESIVWRQLRKKKKEKRKKKKEKEKGKYNCFFFKKKPVHQDHDSIWATLQSFLQVHWLREWYTLKIFEQNHCWWCLSLVGTEKVRSTAKPVPSTRGTQRRKMDFFHPSNATQSTFLKLINIKKTNL